jgi:hypothetical protein
MKYKKEFLDNGKIIFLVSKTRHSDVQETYTVAHATENL